MPLASRAAIATALASLAVPACAAAPANSFNLVNAAGKTVGTAAFTINPDKNGFHLVGKFQYRLTSAVQASDDPSDSHMRSSVGFNEGQFTEDFKVSADGNFLSGFEQNATNQMMTSFQPSKSGEVTVNQIQAGAGQAHSVMMPKPVFLVVPDFDPGALQLFLTTAIGHPHADMTYLFLVPPGANPRGKESPLYVILQLAPDTPAGTLDGKAIALKHYVLNYHVGRADIYTDDAGNLMQAHMGPLDVTYVRAKFALADAAAAK